MAKINEKKLQLLLNETVELAKKNQSGEPATYIPELAHAPLDKTGVSITLNNGKLLSAGNCDDDYYFSLQSTAKVVLLTGLLEEFGSEQVFKWISAEASGRNFNAIDYADRFSEKPSNPMINAGAIALSSHVPGKTLQARMAWLDKWMNTLFDTTLRVNHRIYASELETSDRNFSLAYLMRSKKIISGDIIVIMKTYINLCSYETNIHQASHLPMLFANEGMDEKGKQILNEETVKCVVAIMATCGLYNETGSHLLQTGMPAKSGVSGLILATALDHGGIAVFGPKLTPKGGSVQGHIMLAHLSRELDWHFALRR
jgi:glutaminase